MAAFGSGMGRLALDTVAAAAGTPAAGTGTGAGSDAGHGVDAGSAEERADPVTVGWDAGPLASTTGAMPVLGRGAACIVFDAGAGGRVD